MSKDWKAPALNTKHDHDYKIGPEDLNVAFGCAVGAGGQKKSNLQQKSAHTALAVKACLLGGKQLH